LNVSGGETGDACSPPDPAMRKRFTDLGCDVFTGTPADFKNFIRAETKKWAKLIKFAGIKAD
jgi:tripartite-type tricarboxylate transporter receptor subunit TctC